jgi:hypothetical protein
LSLEVDFQTRRAGRFQHRAAAGLAGLKKSPSLTVRAILASRAVVLLAGMAGALTVSKRAGWQQLDLGGVTSHMGALESVLTGPAVRGDALHYLAIAGHGYGTSAARSPAFFPLFPLLIHLLGYVTGSLVSAGIAVSVLSFVIGLLLLHRLTELELGAPAADATVLLLAFAPLSFFFTAVYTESLFLALSVGAVLAARRQRWALAGALGGLATLTRLSGILLVVLIVIMAWRSRRRVDRRLAWALLVPAGLIAYLAYLAAVGLSWLAPFHDQALWWGRRTVGPVLGVVLALWDAGRSFIGIIHGADPIYDPTRFAPLTPGAENVYLLLVLALAAVVTGLCFRRLRPEYGVYAAGTLLVCVSSPTIGTPLWGLDRYVLTIFPLWMVAGSWIAGRRRNVVITVSAALLAFYTIQFTSWSDFA